MAEKKRDVRAISHLNLAILSTQILRPVLRIPKSPRVRRSTSTGMRCNQGLVGVDVNGVAVEGFCRPI